jgi:cytochrome c
MAHGSARAARLARRLMPVPLLALLLAGCARELPEDAARGRELLAAHGCGACHVIPGVPAARGRGGPPLTAIGRRAYLGGVLPNTPDNMVQWLRQPRHADPGTAMPDVGLTEAQAADVAAYLRTLR